MGFKTHASRHHRPDGCSHRSFFGRQRNGRHHQSKRRGYQRKLQPRRSLLRPCDSHHNLHLLNSKEIQNGTSYPVHPWHRRRLCGCGILLDFRLCVQRRVSQNSQLATSRGQLCGSWRRKRKRGRKIPILPQLSRLCSHRSNQRACHGQRQRSRQHRNQRSCNDTHLGRRRRSRTCVYPRRSRRFCRAYRRPQEPRFYHRSRPC